MLEACFEKWRELEVCQEVARTLQGVTSGPERQRACT